MVLKGRVFYDMQFLRCMVFIFIMFYIGVWLSLARALDLGSRGRRFESRRGHLIRIIRADVAQLAEQLICNQQVIGSSPIIGFLDL